MGGVKETFKNFCMTSSLKGLPKLLRAEGKLLRLLWLSGVLLGAVIGLYQAIAILKAFFEYQTNTHISLRQSAQKTFPDVTVCKVNPSTTVGESGNTTFENYKDMVQLAIDNAQEQDKGILQSIEGLFGFYRNIAIGNESVHASLRDFVVYCKVLKASLSEKCQDPEYNFLTPGYPSCVTFRQDRYRHEVGTWSAVFYLDDFEPESDTKFFKYPTAKYHTGIKVFLHVPGAYPNLRQAYTAGPGQETFLDVVENKHIHQPSPYSDCHEDLNMKNSNVKYTHSNCLYSCEQKELLNMCGCLDPDIPIPKDGKNAHFNFCGYLYVDDHPETVRQVKCWESSVVSISKQCNKQCTQSCNGLAFDSQHFSVQWPHASRHLALYNSFIRDNAKYGDRFQAYSNISNLMKTDRKSAYDILRSTDLISRNFLKLTVYFGNDRTWTYREIPDISTSTMTGSLGGILNLWMGVTFITAIEIVELLINLLRPKPAHEQTDTTNEQQVEVGVPAATTK